MPVASLVAAPKPHILAIIADDYGWGNVGYHRAVPTREVATPTLDGLVKNGLEPAALEAMIGGGPGGAGGAGGADGAGGGGGGRKPVFVAQSHLRTLIVEDNPMPASTELGLVARLGAGPSLTKTGPIEQKDRNL